MLRLTACAADLQNGRIVRDEQSVRLTHLERKLLAYLVDHARRDVPREELLSEVWGYSKSAVSRTVTATVHRLRAKIERDPARPDHVTTVWGCGFRFEPLAPPSPPKAPALDRFFGREDLLAQVSAAIDEHRLITLVGPGGIGKSRVAEEVVRDTALPVVTVGVGFLATAEELFQSTASQLGLRLADTDRANLVAALAERGRLLLVFDEVENLVDEVAELIRDVLVGAPKLVVLCTSRVPLRLSGESVHAVGPLGIEDARELFLDRTVAAAPVDDDALDDVLRTLDGMPLAIELAARLTEVLSVPELARRMERPLDLLTEDRRDRPDRHRSLRAALTDSFETLDVGQQRALAWLAVVRGELDPDDVEALLGPDALGLLRALVQRSLVQRQPAGHRLLHPIRTFALEHLEAIGETGRARETWVAWLVAQCAERFDPSGSPPQPEDGDWAERHLTDLRAAWEWSIESGETGPAMTVPLAWALHVHHHRRGPQPASGTILTRTLEQPVPAGTRGHLLRLLAHTKAAGGARDEATTLAREALAIAEQTGDAVLEGRVCSVLVSLNVDGDEIEGPAARRALEVQGRIDGAGLASTLGVLAVRYWLALRITEAIALCERAVALHRTHGNRRNASICVMNLGAMVSELGEHDRATLCLREALSESRVLGDRRHEAGVLSIMGNLAFKEARFEDAAELFGEACALARAIGAGSRFIADCALNEAYALSFTNELDRAAAAVERAGEWGHRARAPIPEQRWLRAWIALRMGDPGPAEALVATPPPENGNPAVRGLLLVELADAGRYPDGRAEARHLLNQGRAWLLNGLSLRGSNHLVDELESRLNVGGDETSKT